MSKKSGRNIAQFFLELGVLKRFPRTGWLRAGIENPESIADHSFRTAMIAWAIAELESSQLAVRSKQSRIASRKPHHKARADDAPTLQMAMVQQTNRPRFVTANPDINKVIKMALLHDIEESRTGDLDMVMKRYHPNGKKSKAYSDILKNSPYKEEASSLVRELASQRTIESKIVKDADQLDLLLQSIEYENAGFKEAKKWKQGAKRALKLRNSKSLARVIEKQELNWWYPWKG